MPRLRGSLRLEVLLCALQWLDNYLLVFYHYDQLFCCDLDNNEGNRASSSHGIEIQFLFGDGIRQQVCLKSTALHRAHTSSGECDFYDAGILE